MNWFIPFPEAGMTKEKYDVLQDLAQSGDEYWFTCWQFIRSNESLKVSALSVKQQDWLYSIIAGLDREIDRTTSRDLFRTALRDVVRNGPAFKDWQKLMRTRGNYDNSY